MLCSRISSWISCLYCNLLSAQLCSRLLSWCCPNSGGVASKVFQSNRKGIFDGDCSRYLASRLFGKVLVRLDLLMVLTEVRVFLVMMIVLYQKKYLLVHLLCSVHLVYMSVLSNMVVFLWCLGD